MWVILQNALGEEVHRYEETELMSEVESGNTILVYNRRHFIYGDGSYDDSLGDYVIYKESPVRAVPNCIEVP
ncbi:MAG: hypothetical protein AB7L09_21375 [Nitrospira sp.]